KVWFAKIGVFYKTNLTNTDFYYIFTFFYHKSSFWTDGYFVSSIGNVSQETIKKYIENQG
ncbi:MAG: transposase, partial [Bacteroidales bacterium]|nr:transposase [Bacteroidales bacterium]